MNPDRGATELGPSGNNHPGSISPSFSFFTGENASVRLANGSSCSGRVEVHHDGHWGSVCDDGWDWLDARVVCRELGCGDAISAPGGAHFGRGVGPVWVYNATCTGSESSLTQCVNPGVGTSNCNHGEDAGVVCAGFSYPASSTVLLYRVHAAVIICALTGMILAVIITEVKTRRRRAEF
ncbi:UNVERIFIED_CONTAM: hypothetical protein FKN15_032896 [Acipenser sinensis]